jgi:hypothetical protein
VQELHAINSRLVNENNELRRNTNQSSEASSRAQEHSRYASAYSSSSSQNASYRYRELSPPVTPQTRTQSIIYEAPIEMRPRPYARPSTGASEQHIKPTQTISYQLAPIQMQRSKSVSELSDMSEEEEFSLSTTSSAIDRKW